MFGLFNFLCWCRDIFIVRHIDLCYISILPDTFGARQKDSILSTTHFVIYINDNVWQLPFSVNRSVVFYADDILLMTPSLTELQRPLTLRETEL